MTRPMPKEKEREEPRSQVNRPSCPERKQKAHKNTTRQAKRRDKKENTHTHTRAGRGKKRSLSLFTFEYEGQPSVLMRPVANFNKDGYTHVIER